MFRLGFRPIALESPRVIRVIRVIIRMNINIHERDISSPEGSLVTNGGVIRVIRQVY